MKEVKLIEKWFGDPEDTDDDFIRPDRTYFYEIIGPCLVSKRVIYCTKRSISWRLVDEFNASFECGFISRGGLPNETDINWLCDFIGKRELVFIGDMDPTDIMIFGWLRAALPSIKTTHLGINDRLNSRLGYTMPESHRIPLRPSEKSAVSRLEDFIPDVQEVLGTGCLEILRSGFKIELEATILDVGNASQIMEYAIG